MNHIRTMKVQYRTNREMVLQLLGWDMLQYATLQYETGLQYLQQYLQLDDATLQMFERSPRFWDWWVNQWNLRDAQVFLPAVEWYKTHNVDIKAYFAPTKYYQPPAKIETLADLYEYSNGLHYLDNKYPHAHLMHQSYNDMTRKLYADLKKQKV